MKRNISIVPQVFKQNRSLALNLARGFARLNKGKFIDYNINVGKTRELALLTFKITPLCNLQCVMCGQGGKTGTLKHKRQQEAKNIVPMGKYMELTDEVADKSRVFYVWGGEPFMYPNFMELAAYMTKKIIFTVNTNGTHLAKHARQIVEDKWVGIFISLDGFEDVNDAIRGKGTYARVMAGIEAINREKQRQNSIFPYMGIVTTISNMNYMYLDKLAMALGDKGLSWHIINLGTYMNEKIGQEHRVYIQEKLDVDPTYWRGFANGYNQGIDGDKFTEILEKVHSIDNGYPIITVPVIKPKYIGRYYSDLSMLVEDHCAAPWFSANIDYNGDVHFCADYPDYVIGNIKEDKFFDIYNNEKAVRFRKALRKSPAGIFPACKRCYQLMLCGHRRKIK